PSAQLRWAALLALARGFNQVPNPVFSARQLRGRSRKANRRACTLRPDCGAGLSILRSGAHFPHGNARRIAVVPALRDSRCLGSGSASLVIPLAPPLARDPQCDSNRQTLRGASLASSPCVSFN